MASGSHGLVFMDLFYDIPHSCLEYGMGVVGSRGLEPGSDVRGLPKNPYTTGPFGSEVVWVGAGTSFPHPGRG